MKPMHDSVVISKRASKLIWLAAAMSLGLFACQVEDSIERDNPGDAAGANYHLPTVSVTTPADTVFRDSSSLRIRVRDSSANSRVVRLRWSLDGSLSDSTTDASWHPTSGLSEGAHVIVVRAVDSTGLVSLPDTVRVKVYNKPPVLTHVRDTTLLTSQAFTVTLSATDSDGAVKKYLFDTTGNGWDSSVAAPTLHMASASEASRKIRWGVRDDLGKATTDSFVVTFMMDRPVLAAVSDTTISASKTLVVSLNAHPFSSSAVAEYLWSTNGSTWDSSSIASASFSDTAGGALTVQWKARNSLGNYSKPDTFTIGFIPAPTTSSVQVDSSLLDWTGSAGTVNVTWSGSVAGFASEVVTWTLYVGTDSNALIRIDLGTSTSDNIPGVDSGKTWYYRLVGKNRFGDSEETKGRVTTVYVPQPTTTDGIPWNTSIRYGYFTDSRDGQGYYTVKIGSQTWMAQNLNYAGAGVCYGDGAVYCSTYGRQYNWTEVMNGSSSSTARPSGVQGICPAGWHVPSAAEWNTLTIYVDSSTAGTQLKSTLGWSKSMGSTPGNGIDVYGFRALPAGSVYGNSLYPYIGDEAFFWTSTDSSGSFAWSKIFGDGANSGFESYYKSGGSSLRCVKDN